MTGTKKILFGLNQVCFILIFSNCLYDGAACFLKKSFFVVWIEWTLLSDYKRIEITPNEESKRLKRMLDNKSAKRWIWKPM